MYKLFLLVCGLLFTTQAYAVGVTIVAAVAGAAFAATATGIAIAMAINMVVAAIALKAFSTAPSFDGGGAESGTSPNLGNRQQVPPATDNKLPVVYGTAYVGGTVTDLTISQDNLQLYYVISICEVTNTNAGQTPDNITFGNVYYGGKRVIFEADGHTVTSLYDESTGIYDPIEQRMRIYLYKNGSNSPVNTTQSAISILQDPYLIYKWDSTKLMSNCAFAILHLSYSQSRGITSLQQTKFQVTNSRTSVGDCFYDYLTNTRYGCSISPNQIDTASLTALTAYSNEPFTYTTATGATATQPRFKFNGVVDTSRIVMSNIQDMATCCDCLVKYNEVTAKWGVIVQSPTYTVAMDINDSNMISAIQITPLDIAASYNVIECKFPDTTNQDAFNSATFDLSIINPSLLYPNEPVNKLSLSLPLTNNSVTAQYIANRFLKAGREDLQVQVSVTFIGIELDAGDIVTLTSANYGWAAKPFRINKVVQQFNDDGSIAVQLNMSEFNAAIYDDVSVTEYKPAPNTGIGDPTFFGTIPAPAIVTTYPLAAEPSIVLSVVSSSSGVTQYAEIWYSAYQFPTDDQRIFAGTTAIQSNGNPYSTNAVLPNVTLTNIASGNWYFFSRMVNNLASSVYSPASALLQWRPQTFQYVERYIVVAYANSITGTGFSLSPRNKTYYGLLNIPSANPSLVPSDYTWYLASQPFGATTADNFLIFANRNNRKFSFAVDNAAYLGIGGAFVPTESSVYDQTLWSALEDGDNVIDLDERTGQLTKVGTSSVSSADGLLSVTNNTQGTMVVSLQKFLNFGSGVYSKTVAPASLTIDVYGRVVGFTQQDPFYFTETIYVATAGQTVFSVTHILTDLLVFRNGVLLPTTEYTETTSNITMNNACVAGELILIINMRAVSYADYYAPLSINISSSTSNSITYTGAPFQAISAGDKLTFTNTGTPTAYTVSTVNYATKVITFTGTISGATAGNGVYQFRAQNTTYTPFTRWTENFTSVSSYTPTTFSLASGYEQIYVNGAQFNEVDYNLADNVLDGFPAPITGLVDIVMFSANNLGVPCSNITNTVAYSAAGTLTYPFTSNPLSMEVYANGAILAKGSSYDYTASSVSYNLNTAFNNNFTLLNQQTFARDGAA